MVIKYKFLIIMFIVFEIIVIILWLELDNLFYFFNFLYIGICVVIGLFFNIKGVRYVWFVV